MKLKRLILSGFVFGFFLMIPAITFGQAYDTTVNVPDHYQLKTGAFRAEPATTGRVIFLGNSITEGGNWNELFKGVPSLNRGISGDNTFGVLARLDEIIRHKPVKVFLMIGVNDLSKNAPPSRVIENIFSIVSRIHAESPQTLIYVQSILPVNPTHKNFLKQFNKQEDIEAINGQLKKFADPLHYKFVNVNGHFLDGKMALDLQYSTDGLHLNAAGYRHWAEFLKKEKCL